MKKTNIILIIIIILTFVAITIFHLNMKKNEKNNFNEILNTENEISNIEKETANTENETSNLPNEVTATTTTIEVDEEINNSVRKLLATYISEYIFFENSNIGTFPDILRKLNLETENNLKTLLEDNIYTSGNFKTNVKYEDFKYEMLQMMTEKYFNENFSNYTNIDGYVSVNNGAGSYIATELDDIECIFYDDNTNTYIYNAKIKDMEVYDHYLTEDSQITLEECYFYYEVTLKEVNNNIVIDDIKFKEN